MATTQLPSEHTIEVLFRLAAGQDISEILGAGPHLRREDITQAATEALAVLTSQTQRQVKREATRSLASSNAGHLRLVAKIEDPEIPTRSSRPLPERAGKPWTVEEEHVLYDDFVSGVRRSELGHRHGRTRGAITARLRLMGVIDEAGRPTHAIPKFLRTDE